MPVLVASSVVGAAIVCSFERSGTMRWDEPAADAYAATATMPLALGKGGTETINDTARIPMSVLIAFLPSPGNAQATRPGAQRGARRERLHEPDVGYSRAGSGGSRGGARGRERIGRRHGAAPPMARGRRAGPRAGDGPRLR